MWGAGGSESSHFVCLFLLLKSIPQGSKPEHELLAKIGHGAELNFCISFQDLQMKSTKRKEGGKIPHKLPCSTVHARVKGSRCASSHRQMFSDMCMTYDACHTPTSITAFLKACQTWLAPGPEPRAEEEEATISLRAGPEALSPPISRFLSNCYHS